MELDIRWQQRFDSYKKALATLERAVAIAEERPFSELEEQGLIKGFEFTHELSWNLLKDFIESKGFVGIHGSRDTTRIAFREGYIENGEVWMNMIENRNKSSHTYNTDTAQAIVQLVLNSYIEEFRKLKIRMQSYMEAQNDVQTS
jgi:nucleotidyltransferase substrate binding protein (TIGR01987 family)